MLRCIICGGYVKNDGVRGVKNDVCVKNDGVQNRFTLVFSILQEGSFFESKRLRLV